MSREQLQRLAHEGRFEAAAELAESLGLVQESARLWESACQFERAAHAYLKADLPGQALLIAARIAHPALITEALCAVARSRDESLASVTRLEAAHQFDVAARLLLLTGNAKRAAELYERANRPLDAARAYELARLPKPAARVLESTTRRSRDPEANYMLARLYRRSGQRQAAVRALQQLLTAAPEEHQGLLMLADLLLELDLASASREARERCDALSSFAVTDPWGESGSDFEERETVLFGRYVVLEHVATSATAKVYRAQDRATEELVAVKVFSPTLTRGAGRDAFYRFEREIRVLRQLNHPSVVPLHAYHPEGPAAVLRWMAGGSLAQRFERGAQSPAAVVLALTRVLEALADAHRRGIVHRDIKPGNILFDDAGAAFLADFGTAHVADHAATVTSGVLGTLGYMAPEQRRGAKATVASDIYSVGAVLWHALSGAPPIYDRTPDHPGLGEEHVSVLRALLGDPGPESADRARELLGSLSWPTTPAHGATEGEPVRLAPGSAQRQRLKPGPSGSYIDDVLKRPVDVAEYRSDLPDRARAFVAAQHPNLAEVYRFDPKRREIWFERPAIDPHRELTEQMRGKLRGALSALHEHGGYHGSVDRQHVGWRGFEPVLLFANTGRIATLAEDLKGLCDI